MCVCIWLLVETQLWCSRGQQPVGAWGIQCSSRVAEDALMISSGIELPAAHPRFCHPWVTKGLANCFNQWLTAVTWQLRASLLGSKFTQTDLELYFRFLNSLYCFFFQAQLQRGKYSQRKNKFSQPYREVASAEILPRWQVSNSSHLRL